MWARSCQKHLSEINTSSERWYVMKRRCEWGWCSWNGFVHKEKRQKVILFLIYGCSRFGGYTSILFPWLWWDVAMQNKILSDREVWPGMSFFFSLRHTHLDAHTHTCTTQYFCLSSNLHWSFQGPWEQINIWGKVSTLFPENVHF